METALIVLLILIAVSAAVTILFIVQKSRKDKTNKTKDVLKQLETELAITKTKLDKEKERLNTILDTIGAGVIILDRERQVTTLNKTAANLFKVTSGIAAGKTFITLVRDFEMDSIVQKCMNSNHEQTGTIQPSGNGQYLELKAVPLSDGALVLVQDITNIRRLEKIRQDFIVNISHELRTPIASCKAIVETLQNGAINDKKVVKDFLQRMHVETDKLAQMVNELGELSRIESGELKLNLEPVDIAEVIERVKERLKTQADRTRLSINLDIPRDLPRVTGDTDRIEQVLVNLVHNAIKFTPQNGRITISSGVQDSSVLVSVQDTGIGIPEDDLPHIFERFYKVDKARSSGGTGLGLAIAKHIVQAHGGDIRAESEEGKGSIFIFSLPLPGS